MGDVRIETVAQLQAHLKQLLSLDDDRFTATGTQTVCFVDMPAKKLLEHFKDWQGQAGWEKLGRDWVCSNQERNVSFMSERLRLLPHCLFPLLRHYITNI